MLKMKNFLLLGLILPVFAITSCKTAKDQYDGHIHTKSDQVSINLDNFPKSYDSGKKIDVEKIVFTYKGTTYLPLLEGDKIVEGKFFVTRSETTPTLSFVKPANYTVQSNAESADMTFYTGILDAGEIYLSTEIKITVKNAGAMKPWVWYVVTAVVIFGVVAMVFFTRRYKEKHG